MQSDQVFSVQHLAITQSKKSLLQKIMIRNLYPFPPVDSFWRVCKRQLGPQCFQFYSIIIKYICRFIEVGNCLWSLVYEWHDDIIIKCLQYKYEQNISITGQINNYECIIIISLNKICIISYKNYYITAFFFQAYNIQIFPYQLCFFLLLKY